MVITCIGADLKCISQFKTSPSMASPQTLNILSFQLVKFLSPGPKLCSDAPPLDRSQKSNSKAPTPSPLVRTYVVKMSYKKETKSLLDTCTFTHLELPLCPRSMNLLIYHYLKYKLQWLISFHEQTAFNTFIFKHNKCSGIPGGILMFLFD